MSCALAFFAYPDAQQLAGGPVSPSNPVAPTPRATPQPSPGGSTPARATIAGPGPLRFLAIGGGPTAESTEVSLEQDIDLVRQALPAPGLVLFAGGSSSPNVRELEPAPRGDALRIALGDLFAPRAGRHSRYRVPRFAAERATLANVEARLSSALGAGESPLVVYIAAHGDQASEPRNNSVALWGGQALSVARLAELHERYRRPLRLVATSCFSGGFAELAFDRAQADPGRPARVLRCGLFAGTADRETSGCDPNPNRRAQESYGLHFVHALSGTRKDGTALALDVADYDHDGKIGLLDAHTWARIAANSFDVPTTTSERWLRKAEPGSAPIDVRRSPEDAAVIQQLGTALGLLSERAVEERWTHLDRRLTQLDDEVGEAEDALAERAADQATLLLERWPVLDDPFHPDFEPTFQHDRAAIEGALIRSPEAQARAQASERAQALYEQLAVSGVEEARVFRVRRAYETLHKASALLAKGGAAARHYASLLQCERGAP